MWDLPTIIQRNNEIGHDYLMTTDRQLNAEDPHPETWPLSMLGKSLSRGIPSLSSIESLIESAAFLNEFINLVDTFLPDQAEDILNTPMFSRVNRFCYHFGNKYFPLPPYAYRMNVGTLLDGMPIIVMGISYDLYHDLEMSGGCLMLLSLMEYPFKDDERDQEEEDAAERCHLGKIFRIGEYRGARVALLDKVRGIVGDELISRIPDEGWNLYEIIQMCEKTRFESVIPFAKWVFRDTGSELLDHNHEGCQWEEGATEVRFNWSAYNVDRLTHEYPVLRETKRAIVEITRWLEVDPVNNFRDLLNFLLERQPPRSGTRAKFTVEEESWCQLDMVSSYTEDYLEELEDPLRD